MLQRLSQIAASATAPLHFAFVPAKTGRRDILALLDLDSQDGRALRCSPDGSEDPSTWLRRYTTTVPRQVAFVGHAPGQRWPYTGAPSGGDPGVWFKPAWRQAA